MRAVLFPEDDFAFERIVNLPKRGIGEATLQVVRRLARAERVPLAEAARRLVESEELKTRARNALAGFCHSIDNWRARLGREPHAYLVNAILEESGYREMWQRRRRLMLLVGWRIWTNSCSRSLVSPPLKPSWSMSAW